MNRVALLQLLVVGLAAFLVLLIALALSPIWLMIGMINPNFFRPLSTYATQRVTRQTVRSMMTNGRNPV